MRIAMRSLATAGLVALLAAGAGAKPHEKGGGHKQSAQSGPVVDIRIGAGEAERVRAYYAERRLGAERLPPGIAKNLARGKPLPPGIAKRFLPGDLVAALPVLDSRYGRILVGPDLLLIELSSGLVLDIVRGVLG